MIKTKKHKIEDFLKDRLLVLTLNTWVPYLYDVPVILGYPDSFLHRFRYKEQWLTEAIITNIPKIGQKGIIVLRDSLKNINVPLRFFTVSNYNIVNDIHFIDVALHQIVDYGNTNDIRNQRFNKMNDLVNSLTNEYPDVRNKGQKPFVYGIEEEKIRHVWNTPFNLSYDDSTNWRFINEKLIESSQYKDSNFLRIMDDKKDKHKAKGWQKIIKHKLKSISSTIQSIQTPFATSNINSSIKFKRGCYRLKAGNSYYIDLLQIIELSDLAKSNIARVLEKDWGSVSVVDKASLSSSIPYEVNITSSDDCINIAYPKRVAVGEYDRLRFFLRIGNLASQKDCIIEIKALRESEGIYSQPLILPVIIKPRRSTKIIGAILFFVAVFCAGIDDILPVIAKNKLNESVISGVQSFGIISVTIIIGLLTYKVDIFKLK